MLTSSISCPLICLKLKKSFPVRAPCTFRSCTWKRIAPQNASLAHRYTSRTMRSIEDQVRLKRDLYGSRRGCLHAKTSTEASFRPGRLLDFVSRSHDDWVISLYCDCMKVHFMLIKFGGRFKMANITHALPVPVYRQIRQTDFTPKRAWVDFHARSRFARSTIPEEKWGTTRSLFCGGIM